MAEEMIYGTTIEHNGDVDKGLDYLRNHWNDRYILDVFENAKTSQYRSGDFKIQDINGIYVLKYLSEHHYSLSWRSF